MSLTSTIKGWLEDALGHKIAPSTQATEVEVVNPADNTQNTTVASVVESLYTDKAPKASPVFTGTPEAPTAAAGTDTTQIATTAFVQAAVNNAVTVADMMQYQAPVAAANELPSNVADVKNGASYKATAAFTLNGQNVEAGDLIVARVSGNPATLTWDVYQGNIDGAVTGPASSVAMHVPVFSGANGKVIEDSGFTIGVSVPANAEFTDTTYSAAANGGISLSGTEFSLPDTGVAAGSYGPATDATPTYGDTITVPYVTVDAKGKVTACANKTITIPGSDDTVGIPVVENNAAAPSNLSSGALFFRKAAV